MAASAGLLLTAVLAASLVRAAAYDVEAAGASFRRDGFAVLEGFAGADEVAAMKGAMAELEAGYWASPQAAQATVFRTDAGQSGAQAQSRYFFDSADATHFFEEPDGKRLNKAGHALHLRRDAFGAYSRSAKVAKLLRALGYVRPVLPQSMYIFKPPAVGGSVTSHQDASFLRTAPAQTVAGLWLALDDATLANGCLWVRNGSHVEPVRRLFVRDGEKDPSMVFVRPPPDDSGANHLAPPFLDAARRAAPARVPWEGSDVDEGDLAARGYAAVPAAAGTLVVFAGTLDHLSLPNTSPLPRHTFQLHVVESAGTAWHAANWLQTDRVGGFLPLVEEAGEL